MTITYSAAVDEMSALFNEHWQANAAAVVGYVPEVVWPLVDKNLSGDLFWCRFSTDHMDDPQTAMGACETGFTKRYTGYGLIFVQLFCPKSNDRAVEFGRSLAEIARKAFRGKKTDGGIVFRNVRINDNMPAEKLCYRFNVIAEYEYDEVG